MGRKQRGGVVYGAGVVIRRFRVQGRHPTTNGTTFSVVPSSDPRSRFVNSQLVCFLLVRIFNSVMSISFVSAPCLHVNLVLV